MEFHILYIADGHTSFSTSSKFQSLLLEMKKQQQIQIKCKKNARERESERVVANRRIFERDEN